MITAEIYETLSMLNQTQLLKYKSLCTPEEYALLEQQLSSLDYSVLSSPSHYPRGTFSPIPVMTKEQINLNRDYYTSLGLDAIRFGKVGAVLLAGGQGTRLGCNAPKGMFNIGEKKELYIFECLFRSLLDVVQKAGAWIPLFIMTSVQNNDETISFLNEHDFFGYSKGNVYFFSQEELPTVNQNGKLMLVDKNRVSTAPNGNGGWYASMRHSAVMDILNNSGIEWLNVFAVDNVLQRMADPCFIGAVLNSGLECGSKVVVKASPDEKVGVMCLEDGKPSIVEYYEMTDEMRQQKNADGALAYNYGVILNYLFRVNCLERTATEILPLHKAFKKIKYYDGERAICPNEPNAYKFETLALDLVKLQNSCLPFEVERCREFAPVKNKAGVDSVETARALLKLNGVEL